MQTIDSWELAPTHPWRLTALLFVSWMVFGWVSTAVRKEGTLLWCSSVLFESNMEFQDWVFSNLQLPGKCRSDLWEESIWSASCLPRLLNQSLIALHGWCFHHARKALKMMTHFLLHRELAYKSEWSIFYCDNWGIPSEQRACSNYNISYAFYERKWYWMYCLLSHGNEVLLVTRYLFVFQMWKEINQRVFLP